VEPGRLIFGPGIPPGLLGIVNAVTDPISNPWQTQRAAMGAFIRSQRELANMSLRELSKATQVSNAYLSQIERGLHDPTLRVLIQIGDALKLSVDDLLREGGRRRRGRAADRYREGGSARGVPQLPQRAAGGGHCGGGRIFR
jgi:transcriptional regulator with XRE-family HTH domain